MKKKLVVPKFKNEAEEAKFWAKLNLAEYFGPSDFKRGVVFPSLQSTKRLVSIRFPEHLIIKVKDKANKLHMPYQQLIRRYVERMVEIG